MKQILIICFFYSFFCISQQEVVIKYANPQIEELIKLSGAKKSNKTIIVYSIQLQSSETLETIRRSQKRYKSLFPNEIINEIFEPPYFKLMTGAYLDKKITEKKLESIQKKFKSSFILKREITIEEFEQYQIK